MDNACSGFNGAPNSGGSGGVDSTAAFRGDASHLVSSQTPPTIRCNHSYKSNPANLPKYMNISGVQAYTCLVYRGLLEKPACLYTAPEISVR